MLPIVTHTWRAWFSFHVFTQGYTKNFESPPLFSVWLLKISSFSWPRSACLYNLTQHLLLLCTGPQYIVVYSSSRSSWLCCVGRRLSMAQWAVLGPHPGSEPAKPWAAESELQNLVTQPRGPPQHLLLLESLAYFTTTTLNLPGPCVFFLVLYLLCKLFFLVRQSWPRYFNVCLCAFWFLNKAVDSLRTGTMSSFLLGRGDCNQEMSLTITLSGYLWTLTHGCGYPMAYSFSWLVSKPDALDPVCSAWECLAVKWLALFINSVWIPNNLHKTRLATQSCTSQPLNMPQGKLCLLMTCPPLPKNSSWLSSPAPELMQRSCKEIKDVPMCYWNAFKISYSNWELII